MAVRMTGGLEGDTPHARGHRTVQRKQTASRAHRLVVRAPADMSRRGQSGRGRGSRPGSGRMYAHTGPTHQGSQAAVSARDLDLSATRSPGARSAHDYSLEAG